MGSTNREAGHLSHTEDADILPYLFKSLEGSWKLERRLISSDASEPSGRCHGVGHFTFRPPPKVESDIQRYGEVVEMLYHEEGQFQMHAPSVGVRMPNMTFSRNYIWRLNSPGTESRAPLLSLWLTKPGTEELDYLFHTLSIDGQAPNQQTDKFQPRALTVRAHGSHLCVEDQYETDYAFKFGTQEDGARLILVQWQTAHTVKGPKKDQRIETTFTRDDGRP